VKKGRFFKLRSHLSFSRSKTRTNTYTMEAINIAVENLVKMRLKSVLKAIASDFELDLKILKERYLQVEEDEIVSEGESAESVVKPSKKKKTSKKKETKEVSREGKCTCTTAKGLLCRNRALAGGEMCGIHSRSLKAKSDDDAPKKKVTPKNKKKKEPVHTHALDEEVEEGECELCESHGSPLQMVTPMMIGKRLEFEADEDGAKIAAEFEAAMAVSGGEESEGEDSEYVPSEGAEESEEDLV
jgi:histone deacetylase complex regulatory component SIN3